MLNGIAVIATIGVNNTANNTYNHFLSVAIGQSKGPGVDGDTTVARREVSPKGIDVPGLAERISGEGEFGFLTSLGTGAHDIRGRVFQVDGRGKTIQHVIPFQRSIGI
ncbi:MAG TPA: hypothetical protein PKV71_20810, partial [Calditrichia bacterium]|nr:hypothetical protein [Calditrichia bacterium]